MSWFKTDDGFFDHGKAMALEGKGARVWADAISLWLAIGVWSSRNLTDGSIPIDRLYRLTPIAKRRVKQVLPALVEVGMLELTGTDAVLRNFLDYNPSREATLKRRAASARTSKRHDAKKRGRVQSGARTESSSDHEQDHELQTGVEQNQGLTPNLTTSVTPPPIPIPIQENSSSSTGAPAAPPVTAPTAAEIDAVDALPTPRLPGEEEEECAATLAGGPEVEGSVAFYLAKARESMQPPEPEAEAEAEADDEEVAEATPAASDPWRGASATPSFIPPAEGRGHVMSVDEALAWARGEGLAVAARPEITRQFAADQITWGEWQDAWKLAKAHARSVGYVMTTACRARDQRPAKAAAVPDEVARTLDAWAHEREWQVPSNPKVRAIHSRAESMQQVREAFDASHDWDEVIRRLDAARRSPRRSGGGDSLGGLDAAFGAAVG